MENAFLNPCEAPAAGRNESLLNIHSTTSLLNCPADQKQIRIGMRRNVSVSSPNPRLYVTSGKTYGHHVSTT